MRSPKECIFKHSRSAEMTRSRVADATAHTGLTEVSRVETPLKALSFNDSCRSSIKFRGCLCIRICVRVTPRRRPRKRLSSVSLMWYHRAVDRAESQERTMSNVKAETVRGVKWGLIQKFTMQPLQFIYSVILARLISPEEFGILALTSIFFAVAASLAQAGFGMALIRKQDRTEEDCSTMFWFNWGMSCLMGAILFAAAPFFARWYHQPELLWLTRVSALLMTLSCTTSVHMALYNAKRDFKTPAIISMVTSVSGMPVCVAFAYCGYGVWAVLITNVFSSLLNLLIVWWVSPWKPRFLWSQASFRALFGFGSKLALSGVLHTLYTEARTFIIGKFFSPAQLGYYNRGSHLSSMLPTTISGMLESVTYPILSTLQDDNERLQSIYQKYIRITSLPIMWAVFTLMALAHPAVCFIYGERWLPAVPYLQVVSLTVCIVHVSIINLNLLKVKGRTDILLNISFVKKTISVIAMLCAATISVEAICWAMFLSSQFDLALNCIVSGKLINRSWWQQQLDYLPYVLWAVIANIPAYLLTFTGWNDFVVLMLGGSSSAILYLLVMWLRRDSALSEYWGIVCASSYGQRMLKHFAPGRAGE